MTITNTKKTARPSSECKRDIKHLAWDPPQSLYLVMVDDDHATWFKHEKLVIKKEKTSVKRKSGYPYHEGKLPIFGDESFPPPPIVDYPSGIPAGVK